MARAKIGDVVEIYTPVGFAYAHYTHKHAQYGALLRVFSKTYEAKPLDLKSVVAGHPTFSCFFPLNAAVSQKIVSIVGNFDVPDTLQAFPIFRAGVVNSNTGKVDVWWFWDGQDERRVGAISEEQRKLSIRGVWNDTMLIDRIVSGWTPETDPW
jgi:hypothetical protein